MSIEELGSGRYRATIMVKGVRHREVWDTRKQAEAWERRTRRDMRLGVHEAAEAEEPATGRPAAPLFRDYAPDWLRHRRVKGRPLKHGTRRLYAEIIDLLLVPAFGTKRLDAITARQVADWHRTLLPESPTRRAHTYSLLRTILNSAVEEEILTANPCRVKGAGQAERAGRTEIPTVEQLDRLVAAMPGPKYRAMTLMAAWCGLRFGELAELRRKDIATDQDGLPVVVRIRRAVYRGAVDTPKSGAGQRDVTIPPHIRPQVGAWLATRPAKPDVLLFPATRTGGHMPETTVRKHLHVARDAAGLPGLRFHDLRHFSATSAARTGASLVELQRRLGHSTVNAAMRYQHAAQSRDAEIAEAMSRLVPPAAPEPAVQAPEPVAPVIPIRARTPVLVTLPDAAAALGITGRELRARIRSGRVATVRADLDGRERELVALDPEPGAEGLAAAGPAAQ